MKIFLVLLALLPALCVRAGVFGETLDGMNAVLFTFQVEHIDDYMQLPLNYGLAYPEFVGLGLGYRFGTSKKGKFYIYLMSPKDKILTTK